MSQRNSGYERIEDDRYETPAWVTMALLGVYDVVRTVYEPAAGNGKMVRALLASGRAVWSNDIRPLPGLCSVHDFLSVQRLPVGGDVAVVCNPPYGDDRGRTAVKFIEHALILTYANGGQVCALLKSDFDHAKSRRHLFGGSATFAGTVVLVDRIRWIEGSVGSPSENFSWFIWDWNWNGPPIIRYAGVET
jgi:hypothetical protein